MQTSNLDKIRHDRPYIEMKGFHSQVKNNSHVNWLFTFWWGSNFTCKS